METKTSAKQSAIDRLREDGYTLIPLDGKIPMVKNWVYAKPSDFGPDQIENRDGNYGVALKADDLVIDVDPRSFVPGDNPLERLISVVGPVYPSFIVKTGGGGYHIYLKKPKEIVCAHTLKSYKGLEFKSQGRQVVGPGSIHPTTGKEYTIFNDKKAASAPHKLLELLKVDEKGQKNETEEKSSEYKDDPGTQARYSAYLRDSAPLSVSGANGDDTAFKVACAGRDLGLPSIITASLMAEYWNPRCSPPWSTDELEEKVQHAYKYGKRLFGERHPAVDFVGAAPLSELKDEENKEADPYAWKLTKNGQVIKCFHNLLNYLRRPEMGFKGVFGFNEFTGQIEFRAPAPWHKGKMPHSPLIQDKDLKLLKGYLAVKHGFEQSISTIEEALTVVSHDPFNKFHPVREYLEGLEKWDGKKRLDTWLQDYAGALDSEYVRAVSRKTLCAAVSRVMKPGCKFDHVLTLEGPQDAGKSMLCAALGGKWSADFSVDPQSTDTVAAMQGHWFIELAELSVLRRTERNALKAFITRRTDKVRVAYGRLHQEYPRQSIFIGSINPEADNAYLEDPSGNRRWWPVETGGKIDFKGVARDRDQLFAEALLVYEKEELFMDSEELKGEANKVVAERHAEDPWTERIGAWLHDPIPGNTDSGKKRDFVTAREIFIDAMGGIDKQLVRREVVRIANVMRVLGWKSAVVWQGGRPVRGYVPPKKGSEKSVLEGLI